MKVSKKILATVFALPLILGSASVLADGHKSREGNKKKNHQGMNFLLKDIELTQEQKSKLADLKKKNRQNYKEERKAKKQNTQATHKKFQELVLAEKFDEAAVRTLAREMANEQTERRVKRLRHQNEVFNILTPAQKNQVKANIEKHGREMREKMKGKNEK